jgi:hypothetical protein
MPSQVSTTDGTEFFAGKNTYVEGGFHAIP